MFVGPHASRLRLPRPDSAAAIQRPKSVPGWVGPSRQSPTLQASNTLNGSPGTQEGRLQRVRSALKGRRSEALHLAPWASAQAKHDTVLSSTLQSSISPRSKNSEWRRGRHCKDTWQVRRPRQKAYASEQQLQNLCKQHFGARSLPQDVSIDWNLFLNMLEWEVDRDHATTRMEDVP